MRKGEWAEIADVSGIECVGIVKSCPGGEFAAGTKVAALMGGLGRTINGSYAEYTRAPVTNVAPIESGLPWAELAAIPETYATAWTCLFRNLEIASGQIARHPRSDLVLRPGGPQHGGQRRRPSHRHDAAAATASRCWRCWGPSAAKSSGRICRNVSPRRGRSTPCSTWSATAPSSIPWRCCAGRPLLPGRLAGRPRSDRRLQPAAADGERRLPDVLRQLRVR